MAKVFITGIAGFLGSHLADAMLADGHEVTGVDNLLGGYKDNVSPEIEWAVADCCNFDTMKTLMKGVDVVYHCAATAYEGLSVFSPALVSKNIMEASVTTFSAAIANQVRRVVHCSSMARYGGQPTPFKENMTPLPQDPYGIAKVGAEEMLKNLGRTHGMDYVIAVPHNIYGPRQKYDDPFRNVASIMMNLVLQGRAPIIYGDGEQQRCFSYIDDCLQCLTAMAFAPHVVGHTINIGPDENPVTINDLCRDVLAVCGRPGMMPMYYPGRPQEVKIALCSSDKARRLLDYRTTTALYEGLEKMYSWMVKRGPKPFNYHLPLEFTTPRTPRTWTDRLF